MKPRVLVVSSANMDLIQRIDRLPDRGETHVEEERTFSYMPGGKGANSAVTFARMGIDCVFCTRIGQDTNGSRLLRIYEKEGIDTRYVLTDRTAQTGLASILVESNGSNRIIVYPGANRNLSPSDVEDAMTCLPDAVYLQFEIPEEAVLAAARFASRRRIPLYVDAGPAREDFPLDKLGEVEVFSPNETETFIYTGIRPNTQENCLRACIRLASMVKARFIVLKLGEKGCYIYDGKFYHIIPAMETTAVDTTGAGDIFTAAMTSYCMQGYGIVEAARFGTYAAGLSVTKAGAFPSVPTLAETVRALTEEYR